MPVRRARSLGSDGDTSLTEVPRVAQPLDDRVARILDALVVQAALVAQLLDALVAQPLDDRVARIGRSGRAGRSGRSARSGRSDSGRSGRAWCSAAWPCSHAALFEADNL